LPLDIIAYALGANFSFALGSIFFTHYSRSLGAHWTNWFKALVAALSFGLYLSITQTWGIPYSREVVFLLVSGFIGLGMGDVFILKAFSQMGPGRTMILFSFQPLVMALFAFIQLGQTLVGYKAIAILFLGLCVFIINIEAFRQRGHWEIKGVIFAFMGMLLDAFGIILTRQAFDGSEIDAFNANFIRCIGALCFFGVWSLFKPLQLLSKVKELKGIDLTRIIFGSWLGTFLALSLYLTAIKSAHLASLTALSVSGTIFSNGLECLYLKKWPSRYLLLALISFGLGMRFLLS
jgi:drug/metabolite transporter (DMT)-like permease